MSATGLVDPAKISSANGLFQELYYMVEGFLCPVPNPPTAMRNILNNFFDTVKITSLDNIKNKKNLKKSYFSSYHDTDAVFYPFQPADVVEVGFFLETVARWMVVINYLEEHAAFLEDVELEENLYLWKEELELL